MKKKLILLNSALMIAVAAVSFVAASKNDSKSSLLVQNVEALANGEQEELDTSYVVDSKTCEIYIGIGGKIKVVGVGIIKAGADGVVRFTGAQECLSGGNSTCAPVRCNELWSHL